jgi:hypothetical protein
MDYLCSKSQYYGQQCPLETPICTAFDTGIIAYTIYMHITISIYVNCNNILLINT